MLLFEKVIFNSEECKDIIRSIIQWEEAGLYVKKNNTEYTILQKPKLRKSFRSDIVVRKGAPTFDNLKLALNEVGFDITSDTLEGSVLKYGKGDFLYKHDDLTDHNNTRIACCVTQLSDLTDYNGGELICYNGDEKIIVNKSIGNTVIFRPEVPHETLIIESGERYSLVIWAKAEDVKSIRKNQLI